MKTARILIVDDDLAHAESLADALDALEADHGFLLRGDVFPESLIRRWLEIKREEINAINRRPHPYEFTMYFDF